MSNGIESKERVAFLDLLCETLLQHEKSLNELIDRLEGIVNELQDLLREVNKDGKKKPR